MPPSLPTLRHRTRKSLPEKTCVQFLLTQVKHPNTVKQIAQRATYLAETVRQSPATGLMQEFLTTYGFSSREGTALMCLAEAYLRTPDKPSLDALIRDKIGSHTWHTAKSPSSLVMSASHWSLMLSGQLFKDFEQEQSLLNTMRRIVQKLGEPLARAAIGKAMEMLGGQFVLGETIEQALKAASQYHQQNGCFSFDMLGEAAKTTPDALRYWSAYQTAAKTTAATAKHPSIHSNSGISVKLSAIHPRYEYTQKQRVDDELIPRLATLVQQTQEYNIPLTLDAEEADRSDMLLHILERILAEGLSSGGFGIVIQAYRKNAFASIQWLQALARKYQQHIPVRLVKGAYWDSEIKHAQTLGLKNYPVFTRKCATDLSYLACAQLLLTMREDIRPQFGTHNAYSAAAILEYAGNDLSGFEFQRIHGMGETLHQTLNTQYPLPDATASRIYAPVGRHKDLLAYLVRRMLENGANSSFVYQALDKNIPLADLVANPIDAVEKASSFPHPRVPLPPKLYGVKRKNAKGWNLNDPTETLPEEIKPFLQKQYLARSLVAKATPKATPQATRDAEAKAEPRFSPADTKMCLGEVIDASAQDVETALANANRAFANWNAKGYAKRAEILETAADLYEQHSAELIALLSREAGRTLWDAISELREAVDFCRYYAARARSDLPKREGRGIVLCIAPWNFPLAIFTGQIAAALVCGNSVIAKPAEQTPLVAHLASQLLYRAGVPREVFSCLFGLGSRVGASLTRSALISGVCFTGSEQTAQAIDRNLSRLPHAAARFLIAETGGINAMIADSTALAEQAVRDILISAFQSAGQRCSALRLLFVQQEIADSLLEMLVGAAGELRLGQPWLPSTDIGPLIDRAATTRVQRWCRTLERSEQIQRLFRASLPSGAKNGYWFAPRIYRLDTSNRLETEVFGPVLHVVSFQEKERATLPARINRMGYGLTLGIHSRVESRVRSITEQAHIGNIYVNRNQIGAVVGCQPFGGEGLSGTGPKAGGVYMLRRLSKPKGRALFPVLLPSDSSAGIKSSGKAEKGRHALHTARSLWREAQTRLRLLGRHVETWPSEPRTAARAILAQVEARYRSDGLLLEGVTGERNRLFTAARGTICCLGEQRALALQILASLAFGNRVYVAVAMDAYSAGLVAFAPRGEVKFGSAESGLALCAAALYEGEDEDEAKKSAFRATLAARTQRCLLLDLQQDIDLLATERLVSEDTTASGGNASLLLEASSA